MAVKADGTKQNGRHISEKLSDAQYLYINGSATESSGHRIDEIQKVVVMPLDGDDDAGVFAIMIPQKSDRSLHGLQSFRPYEVSLMPIRLI